MVIGTDSWCLRLYRDQLDIHSLFNLYQQCRPIDQLEKAYSLLSLTRELEHLTNFDPAEQLVFAQSRTNNSILGSISCNWRTGIDGSGIFEIHNWMVDPNWRGIGIEEALLNYAQSMLTKKYLTQGMGKGWLQTKIKDSEHALSHVLINEGYSVHQQSIKMVRPVHLEFPFVKPPGDFIFRKPEPSEYLAVLKANDESFIDLWGYTPKTEEQFEQWKYDRLFQPQYWQVAWDQDEVAGMVLGYIDAEENAVFNRRRGYTEEIAVRRPWRRRGLARWLLSESIRMFAEIGMDETALSVHKDNQSGAYPLYLQLGYEPVSVFQYYRKRM